MIEESLLAGANVIVNNWLSLRRGEKFLLIHDEKYAAEAEALQKVAESTGAQTQRVLFHRPRAHSDQLSGMFAGADVAMGVTDYSLLTTRSVLDAVRAGMRYLSFPPITLDGRSILAYDFIQEDIHWAEETGEQLVELAMPHHDIHVTTPAGTDIHFRFRGRIPAIITGNCQCPGDIASSSFEFYIPIEENQTEGVLVLDGAMGQIGGLTQPLRLEYQGGRIVTIGPGADGDRLRAYIASFDDERAFLASEFGIGLNRLARCLGRCYIEDESALSTCHIGHGRNLTLGGELDAEGHYDLIILHPTISIGQVTVMRDGQLTI